jgi:glycosyltransferase involved in cell wall biosynthesis
VVSLESPQGVGAAVRRGLSEGVACGAVAVGFCDADAEYDPAELELLVSHILTGRADYVVGSRFAGGPRRMRPHRLLGNLVLSRLLSAVARVHISDGQSGYRALSRRAAAEAEVIHDFNYAQVLTLDLLAKGFTYMEVPISYQHRTTGHSFVRVIPYLLRVIPAVIREMRAPSKTIAN